MLYCEFTSHSHALQPWLYTQYSTAAQTLIIAYFISIKLKTHAFINKYISIYIYLLEAYVEDKHSYLSVDFPMCFSSSVEWWWHIQL